MYIRSTGLGRTLLQARAAKIESVQIVPTTLENPQKGENEPTRLLMTIDVISPVTWTVRVFVEPSDMRRIMSLAIKNRKVLFRFIRFLIFGGRSPSLIVEKRD
jgi:hypothetical protein